MCPRYALAGFSVLSAVVLTGLCDLGFLRLPKIDQNLETQRSLGTAAEYAETAS